MAEAVARKVHVVTAAHLRHAADTVPRAGAVIVRWAPHTARRTLQPLWKTTLARRVEAH
jgi:hypothetical protein